MCNRFQVTQDARCQIDEIGSIASVAPDLYGKPVKFVIAPVQPEGRITVTYLDDLCVYQAPTLQAGILAQGCGEWQDMARFPHMIPAWIM